MSKLAWVLLPLALVGAVLAWLAWRRRLPSRPALNVLFSLLLLAYVGTTAGLGIFWVANQQLPVFDWHYLFGYATVLLLVVHLAFNFRIVWRHLVRRRDAGPIASAPPAARSRIVLPAAGALLAAAGGGYWLGLRHGRTTLQVGSGAAGADPALAVAEAFHEYSAHSRRGVFRRAPGSDWGDAPPPFKAYPQASRLTLPPPRHDDAATAALDLQTLSTLLWHTAAVNLQRGTLHLRTSPSSGALFATEWYLVAAEVEGLAPGRWHYDPLAHALHRLGDPDGAGAAAPLQVVASAIFRRCGQKYGDRAYRYVLADLGHQLENSCAAAAALGLAARLEPAFDGPRWATRFGLDESEEGVLAVLTLGGSAAPDAADAPAWQTPELSVQTGSLGVTDAIHRATSLQRAAAPTRPRRAPATLPPSVPAAYPGDPLVRTLPAPERHGQGRLRSIARRRSSRRFAAEPLVQPHVAALLAAAARAGTPALSSAVRIHLLSMAVDGLDGAAWRCDAGARTLTRTRAIEGLRSTARQAALDQDVVGDAAAVFVFTLDRATFAADPLGAARGYRHAFIEAGRAGERLYLEAVALGLGVCGVGAFYDDEAAALVGVDPAREWVVHFVAVGRPA